MHITTPNAVRDGFQKSINQTIGAFGNLTGDAKTRFESLGEEMHFSRGETIFSEGRMPHHIFFLRSGRVKLTVSSREGKTAILRIAESGQVLGLSATLLGSEYEASAEALEPCQIFAVPVGDFMCFLEKYPDAALEATRCVLKEYQMMFNGICRLALPTTVAGRLANLLLDWLKRRSQSGQPKQRFTMALTHEEIASMTATSRETVTRVFNQFEREKLISIKGASFTVLQPEALEQLAV